MIEPLDIYNMDGFGNESYKDDYVEELEQQLQMIQRKINEVIDYINSGRND